MARLEDITRGATIKGILPDDLVTIVDVEWHGTSAVTLTYKDATGRPFTELLFRDREATIELASDGRLWAFDAAGALFRLVSEAHRIRLAYLFDPLLAVHSSLIEPLPHQITAVYSETAVAPAAALSAGRRSWRRQDDHGRAADQRAPGARRCPALPDCLPRQSG